MYFHYINKILVVITFIFLYVVKINFHQEIQTKYSLTHKLVNIPTVVKMVKTEWEK